jgi:hypothetical protein
MTPDAKQVLVWYDGRVVEKRQTNAEVRDSASGSLISELPLSQVKACAISEDGKSVLLVDGKHTLYEWPWQEKNARRIIELRLLKRIRWAFAFSMYLCVATPLCICCYWIVELYRMFPWSGAAEGILVLLVLIGKRSRLSHMH